ncbi:chaperone NapD [Massilia agri]|uniref:Chaperone NapD n=1 Tax=Massilia agri TaxID=1886785 RepID=A0ABT2ALY7_9BURK|nr:chaperone NapD [Massilia agri]MCS0597262.1 chaperone NapD [Massilia agri]
MSEEIHIAGIIVAATRTHAVTVRANLALLPKTIIHAAAEDGRMVVTLETTSTQATLDCMDAIRALPGVLNVALVYQHAESAAAMEETIS